MFDLTAIKAMNLIDIAGRHTKLHNINSKEPYGPCPKCGGNDRFHVKKEWFFCRKCHETPGDIIEFTMWLNGMGTDSESFKRAVMMLGGNRLNISQAELDKIAAARAQAEAAERAEEERKRAEAVSWLRSSKVAERYHAHPQAVEMWAQRGLSEFWVNYYGLGYCPGKEFMHDGEPFTSPTLTIPYYRVNKKTGAWEVISLRHRLLMGDCPGGKYRPERAGLGNHLYLPDPTMPDYDRVLVVEGEIKGMITHAMLRDADEYMHDLCIKASPGDQWKPEYLDELRQARQVWICMDPDTYERPARARDDWRPLPVRMADAIPGAKVIRLAGKIDDMILAGAVDAQNLFEMLE
jgi:hypothetical protein